MPAGRSGHGHSYCSSSGGRQWQWRAEEQSGRRHSRRVGSSMWEAGCTAVVAAPAEK